MLITINIHSRDISTLALKAYLVSILYRLRLFLFCNIQESRVTTLRLQVRILCRIVHGCKKICSAEKHFNGFFGKLLFPLSAKKFTKQQSNLKFLPNMHCGGQLFVKRSAKQRCMRS